MKASETWEEQLESALVELRGNVSKALSGRYLGRVVKRNFINNSPAIQQEHAGPFLKPVKRTEAPDYDKGKLLHHYHHDSRRGSFRQVSYT